LDEAEIDRLLTELGLEMPHADTDGDDLPTAIDDLEDWEWR
jgi:hypothetical protein